MPAKFDNNVHLCSGGRSPEVHPRFLSPIPKTFHDFSEHSGFEDRAGGIRLPQRTTINDLVRKKTLYVRYTEVEPNVEPNANVFVLSPPDGITNEEVSCGAR